MADTTGQGEGEAFALLGACGAAVQLVLGHFMCKQIGQGGSCRADISSSITMQIDAATEQERMVGQPLLDQMGHTVSCSALEQLRDRLLRQSTSIAMWLAGIWNLT